MADPVKLIECPRDAWQGLKELIPAELKTDYLKALISVGFKHIDAASFVSPKAVPQMADSEEVLKELDPPDDVEIIGIVVNEKGAERAIETKAVSTLGFPYSVSDTFLRKNQNQSPEEALDELEKIQKKADDAGLEVVVYISMAFGNRYGCLLYTSPGMHKIETPVQLATVDELIIPTSYKAVSTDDPAFALFVFYPQAGLVEVLPQKWFTSAQYRVGQQWITRAARDPESHRIVGECFGAGTFLLEEDGLSLIHI